MHNPLKAIKPFVVKHQPELLMGFGLSGLLFSTFWATKASFKVSKKIENYKKEHACDKLTKKEIFKLAWRDYLPVVLSTAFSIPCIVCGNRISNKRYTALAAAYTISETALQEYREKTREIVGEKKAQQIQEAANDEAVKRTFQNNSKIIMTNTGENLFYEPLTDRYFMSSWNNIQRAQNELNAKCLQSTTGEILLNDWFEALGLPGTDLGNYIGWRLVDSNANLIDVEISGALTTDKQPCGALTYRKRPIELSDSLYR